MTTPTDAPITADAALIGGARSPDHHGLSIRDANLILARAHLRFGLLGLARAELETMAGRDELDDDGIRDLAEARWRTGDTTGAGEAAAAFLEVAPDDIVALVIAAEAQADLGRPGEARRLAGQAMERAEGSLDPIFAGMRRSSIWPVETGVDGAGPVGVLFNELHPGPVPPAAGLDRRATDRAATNGAGATYAPLDPALPAVFEAARGPGPGLWDAEPGATLAADSEEADPAELLQGARVALDHGQTAEAATGLMLALRTAPELAPAVLDLLSGRSEPILLLVRGDANRIVGRDVDAMRDHAAAANRIGDPMMAAPTTAALGEAEAEAEPEALWPLEPEPQAAAQPEPETEADEPKATADSEPVDGESVGPDSTEPEPNAPDQEDS